MAGKLARGAFLIIMGLMVVSWAVSVGQSSQAEPQDMPPIERIYS